MVDSVVVSGSSPNSYPEVICKNNLDNLGFKICCFVVRVNLVFKW